HGKPEPFVKRGKDDGSGTAYQRDQCRLRHVVDALDPAPAMVLPALRLLQLQEQLLLSLHLPAFTADNQQRQRHAGAQICIDQSRFSAQARRKIADIRKSQRRTSLPVVLLLLFPGPAHIVPEARWIGTYSSHVVHRRSKSS